MFHHQLSEKKSDEIALDQSHATDIDTVARGSALGQDHETEEIEVVVSVETEAVTEAAIVVATEIEVDDTEAEAGVDQEIDHPEEEGREVDQEVDLVLDQDLPESDLKIPTKS